MNTIQEKNNIIKEMKKDYKDLQIKNNKTVDELIESYDIKLSKILDSKNLEIKQLQHDNNIMLDKLSSFYKN